MLRDRVLRRLFARLANHLYRARGYPKYCLFVVLLVAFSTLSALAYASTPDTAGLPGIYDDADHDDVVSLLTDTVGLGTSRLTSVDPLPLLLGVASFRLAPAPRDGSFLSFHPRSPPAA
jgi:hypothetical protein